MDNSEEIIAGLQDLVTTLAVNNMELEKINTVLGDSLDKLRNKHSGAHDRIRELENENEALKAAFTKIGG